MIRKVEYVETNIDSNAIAMDAFYHILMKNVNDDFMDQVDEFYIKNKLTSDMRYSIMKDKIVSIK